MTLSQFLFIFSKIEHCAKFNKAFLFTYNNYLFFFESITINHYSPVTYSAAASPAILPVFTANPILFPGRVKL